MSKYVKSFLDGAFHISYWPDDNNKLTKYMTTTMSPFLGLYGQVILQKLWLAIFKKTAIVPKNDDSNAPKITVMGNFNKF